MVGRRAMLRGGALGAAGLAAASLVGCGGSDNKATSPQATLPSGAGQVGTATGGAAAKGGTPVPKEQVRLKPGIYQGPVAASPAEANPEVNAKRGGTLKMYYLDPPRMDISRTLSCTIYHTMNYPQNKLVRGRVGASAPLYSVEVEPDLAESWEVLNGAQQFTFKLRKGVKTHNVAPLNGREFTSEDVVASMELYRKGGTQKDVFAPVTSITAPDPYTVVVKLDQPLADFPSNIASWSFMYAKEFVADDNLRQERAAGTGPFIQKEWVKKERSDFVKHPDYFEKGLPYVDGINVVPSTGDQNVARAAYQTDNVMEWNPPTDADAADMFKSKGDSMVMTKFPTARGANVNGFQFQMKNPVFQDERVRRALSLAFDRAEFDRAYNASDNENPEGPYSNSPMPWALLFDQYPTAKANGQWYKFDAKQASALMQAAGYTKEKPLAFTLQSFYYYQALSEVVVPGINQNLPEVKITWKMIDNPTHVTLMSDRNFPEAVGFLWGPSGFSMDQWLYPFYHSKGGNNYGNISDPDLDALLVKQRATTEAKAKKDVWNQIYARIHDKLYQAWFPEAKLRSAWPNYLMNYRYHAYMGSYICYTSDQARAMWLDDGTPGLKRT
jgi:peptide/nickel transport system substrate-binding protein